MNDKQRKRLTEAIDEYNNAYPNYDETFNEVNERIGRAGHATKLDVSTLVFWKRIRVGRWAGEFLDLPDEEVRRVTAAAFAEELEPVARLRTLGQLPGFRSWGAIASTLLAAWNPADFGVMDRRAWKGLERLGIPYASVRSYVTYLETLRGLRSDMRRGSLRVRDLDKGLFMLGEGA